MKAFIGVIFLLVASSAMAGTSAGYGMGGQFSRFDPVVAEANRSGELFRIEGHCQSACTLFLKWTNHMLSAYNARLRSYLVSNHYVDTLAFHTISGSDIIKKFGYRECPK
jgi:hypothetical protein